MKRKNMFREWGIPLAEAYPHNMAVCAALHVAAAGIAMHKTVGHVAANIAAYNIAMLISAVTAFSPEGTSVSALKFASHSSGHIGKFALVASLKRVLIIVFIAVAVLLAVLSSAQCSVVETVGVAAFTDAKDLQRPLPDLIPLTGEGILEKVDENYVAKNRKVTSTMIVKGQRGSRTLQVLSWVQGTEKAFSEFLSPPREKGTKMLKLEDELWMYTPSTDRIIKIAGHMLRRSMMGSDISYEDYMEDPKLSNMYNVELVGEGKVGKERTGEDKLGERDCYLLELTAKKEGVSYYSRKMWVDKENFLPLREDRFAKSGKLLKTFTINEIFQVQERWYPKRATVKDALASGEGTEYIIDTIEFDVEIPDYIFSKASLRQ
ncbi:MULTISPECIES: outer membrane lipoprotein-sorting protein [Aminobacterium]|jgi:outer membrane lipoprotein-sorting protein|uniref:outer membrane lipoprotein-sorting protein n=1 Tax=Aminobacterium TaxID=81466 RepID=UPI0025794753|nr:MULTISPECIES: outer membrane lipoprotein-sorting protein [unclassified Aminobacterium]